LLAAGAASLFSGAALAADLPMAPPPQYYAPPPVEDFGGWYLRGDIGLNASSGKLHNNLYDTLPATASLQHLGHNFSGGTSYGIGVGYQFNNWFRGDITGEYRGKSNFHGLDLITFDNGGTTGFGSDHYTGSKSEWLFLANAYADLGTWYCVTPFIGAGIGAAHVTTSGFQDTGLANGVPGSYFASGASTTNLAWALHAGLAYKVTNNLTVELAYRYLDMGKAVHGFGSSYDGTNAGPSSFEYRDLTSQDVKIGLRWTCCEVPPPPPPPIVTKG
jgi:opacity protein-like surface antigen